MLSSPIFTEQYKGLIESFVTWCNGNHLKFIISKTYDLVVDYSASITDVAAEKLQSLKRRWTVYNQRWNTVIISPSVPEWPIGY